MPWKGFLDLFYINRHLIANPTLTTRGLMVVEYFTYNLHGPVIKNMYLCTKYLSM